MNENKGIPLEGKDTSNDPAMKKVIDVQARIKELKRENRQLLKDREQLLEEYLDKVNSRPLPPAPTKRKVARAERIRIMMGDLHGMYMDRACAEAVLADVEELDPDEIVLGGDMAEVGGWLAKHQPIGFVALSDYTYQEDISATTWFLDKLQMAAPHATIHYLEGNHEQRVERWVMDQTQAHKRDGEFLLQAFGPQALLRLEDRKIQYYKQDGIHGKGLPRGWIKLGKMFFVHELKTSKNAAMDGLASTADHVTYFHSHRSDAATMVYPSVGMVKAFCPGCLCKTQPIWRHSKPNSWSQGYDVDFITKDGVFQRIQAPIWRGKSIIHAVIDRFKK